MGNVKENNILHNNRNEIYIMCNAIVRIPGIMLLCKNSPPVWFYVLEPID